MLRLASWMGVVMVGLGAPACSLYCFGGATWIATPRGRKRLRDMQVGDWVLSFDDRAGRLVESQVERVFAHGPRATGRLGGVGPGAVTANHPVFDEATGEYVRADALRPGVSTLLVWRRGQLGRRRAEPLTFSGAVEPVFNLQIAGTHTYVADGVVVHNKSTNGPEGPSPSLPGSGGVGVGPSLPTGGAPSGGAAGGNVGGETADGGAPIVGGMGGLGGTLGR